MRAFGVILLTIGAVAAPAGAAEPAITSAAQADPAQSAAPAPASASEPIRLTPEQIAAAQAEGEHRNRAAEALALTDDDFGAPRRDRKVHGEVGFGIGSGGSNSQYGTVVAPLGDSGTAAFSYERNDYGRNYRRGYYGGAGLGWCGRAYALLLPSLLLLSREGGRGAETVRRPKHQTADPAPQPC